MMILNYFKLTFSLVVISKVCKLNVFVVNNILTFIVSSPSEFMANAVGPEWGWGTDT